MGALLSTFSFNNPLPDYCNDDKKLKQLVQGYRLRPRRGTTTSSQHSFCELEEFLYHNSPTFKAIIEDKKSWIFGSNLDIVNKSRPFLISKKDNKEVDQNLKERFYDFYKDHGLSFEKISALSKRLYTFEHIDGNPYLRYKEVEFGGVKKVHLSIVNPRCLMKVIWDKEDNVKHESCIISNDFNSLSSLKQGENFDLVNVYPAFSKIPGGRETIIHFRQEDSMKCYDESKSGNSLYWQFVQWAASDLACKVTGSAIVTKNVLFYKAVAEDDNMSGDNTHLRTGEMIAQSLKKVFSRDGNDPKTTALLLYPDEKPSLEKVDVNRDHEWLDKIMEISTRLILQSERWSSVVSGLEKPSSGIGGNTVVDEMRRVKGVVDSEQELYESRWQMIFEIINEFLGSPDEFKGLGIKYYDQLGEAISQYDTKKETIKPVGSTNT